MGLYYNNNAYGFWYGYLWSVIVSAVSTQWEFLKDVAKLIQYADSLGLVLTGGELYRTAYQQAEYIRTGKSKTMNSKHLSRLAIDLNLFKDNKLTYEIKDYEPLGKYWESLNPKNEYGGFWTWKDAPHFERNT